MLSNYIGILTSVNCSAHVAGMVADVFKRNPFMGYEPLADYPNVDGVVALTHNTGCGMSGGEPLNLLRRTLAGYARHPNFSHVIVLGLGCEVNQIGGLIQEQRLADRIRNMDIQSMGGTRKTVEAGIEFVREVLAEANEIRRETVPASELKVALQCGGSDGYPACRPTRRLAWRVISWCATAVPSSCRKRPRHMVPNTCSHGARSAGRSGRSLLS
jgi:altronate hydrolase